MAFPPSDDQAELGARALKEAVQPVAAELRLVEVADFIAYIHSEQFANIQDIVNSSIELFFKPGTLSYGGGAYFELDWDRAPIIIIDMEFRHRAVRVIFKLTLSAQEAHVAIEHCSTGASTSGKDRETARLIEALADARNPKTGH
jgi:hypothetical protein